MPSENTEGLQKQADVSETAIDAMACDTRSVAYQIIIASLSACIIAQRSVARGFLYHPYLNSTSV
jgi:hypothetical protein